MMSKGTQEKHLWNWLALRVIERYENAKATGIAPVRVLRVCGFLRTWQKLGTHTASFSRRQQRAGPRFAGKARIEPI